MTSFSPGPQFWIEDSPDDDGDDGGWGDGPGDPGGPGGPTPPQPPRGWLRWAALGAGLAVIAGLIAWQSRTGIAGDAVADTLQGTSTAVTSARRCLASIRAVPYPWSSPAMPS